MTSWIWHFDICDARTSLERGRTHLAALQTIASNHTLPAHMFDRLNTENMLTDRARLDDTDFRRLNKALQLRIVNFATANQQNIKS